MTGIIADNDLRIIGEVAERYNLSMNEFCKMIAQQFEKKSGKRQFRLSEKEFEIISQKAKDSGVTATRYCENACKRFSEVGTIDDSFFGCRTYGGDRTKRITISFKDKLVEQKMIELSDKLNIEISSLIRYSALYY